jgi:phytoene/squalene synthetase
MSEDDALYCRQKARECDIDAYLAALFAPADARPALWALDALAGEIARVALPVSEPLLGQIRLQWWHDAIGALYRGRADPHPVLNELAPVIKAAPLKQSALEELIEARLRALEQGEPEETAVIAHTALLNLKHDVLFGTARRLSVAVMKPAAQARALGECLRRDGNHDAALVQRAQEAVEEAAHAFAAERAPAHALALLLPLTTLRLTLKRFSKGRAEPPVYQKQWAMLRAVLSARV